MTKPRFLLEEILSAPGERTLGREESHHAVNVLRLRAGDEVIVFDGRGRRAEAVVLDADRRALRVRAGAVTTEDRPSPKLTIAAAIPKGKRWQGLVEKCTELGADGILPLHTERSVAKGEGDAEKWRRWAAEAAKQSRRWSLPEIAEPAPFAEALDAAKRENSLLFLADGAGEDIVRFRDGLLAAENVFVFVGPEGGFTEEESSAALERGARAVRLSSGVLRVETAAAAACALVREIAIRETTVRS